MVDAITRASMIAIMARWQLAWHENQIQTAIRDAAAKKVSDTSKILDECKAQAKSLGFDRDEKDTWQEAIAPFIPGAQELYSQVKTPDLPDWNYAIKDKLLTHDPAGASDEAPQAGEKRERPSIRQIVLDRLADAGEGGAKAIDIRKYIETTYSEEIHEKTVGMTLYRLLQDELVRRQGHTWFLVPQNTAETKNPGGETPGLIEDLL